MLFSRGRYESGLVTYIRFVLANVRRAQLAPSPGGKPTIKESRKDWTSAGNRASLVRPRRAPTALWGSCPAGFRAVRGFGGGGARRHSNRTKDLDKCHSKS